MVNEINKPPPSVTENAHLEERLATSNRHLQQMQEEHRQLVQEMEMLRERAEELSRLNAQQEHLRQEITNESDDDENDEDDQSTESDADYLEFSENSSKENKPLEATPGNVENKAGAACLASNSSTAIEMTSDDRQKERPTAPTTKTETDTSADSTESAEYIQQKLAEVVALKAQLRRVQNMMNTTNLIEQHMTLKEDNEPARRDQTTEQQPRNDIAARSSAFLEQSPSDFRNISENELLLSTMMNMFSDFTSDLREQADNLRAERERIRALKEDLIRRKASPKDLE